MDVVIGVIGLSLQVIDRSIKIKKLIDDYRSASREMRRLGSKIDSSEAICTEIKTQLEAGTLNPKLSNTLQKLGPPILQNIAETLRELEQLLSKLQTKAKNKVSLGTALFMKKDVIKSLSEELSQDLDKLHCLVTMNVLSRLEAIQESCLLSTNVVAHPTSTHVKQTSEYPKPSQKADSASTSDASFLEIQKQLPVNIKVERQIIMRRWALGLYSDYQCIKTTRFIEGCSKSLHKTSDEIHKYRIGRRRFSYTVELFWRFGSFASLRPSLKVLHNVTPQSDEKLDLRLQFSFYGGDVSSLPGVEKLQFVPRLAELLISRQIFLQTRYRGKTLYEVAREYARPDICRLLVRHAPNLFVLDCPQYLPVIPRIETYSIEHNEDHSRRAITTMELDFATTTALFPLEEFVYQAATSVSVRHLKHCFERFRPHVLASWQDFIDHAWENAVNTFVYGLIDDGLAGMVRQQIPLWTLLIRQMMEDGIDIHKSVAGHDMHRGMLPRGTAFSMVVQVSHGLEKLTSNLAVWLEILGGCGVDASVYIDEEMRRWDMNLLGTRRYMDDGGYYDNHPEECRLATIAGFEVPCWRRWIDPASPALDMMQAFQGLDTHIREAWLQDPAKLDGLVARFADEGPSMCKRVGAVEWEENWPLVWVPGVHGHGALFWWLECIAPEAAAFLGPFFDKAVLLTRQRFERRQSRRRAKDGVPRHPKRHGTRMPGAWVDGY